jgi:methyl-coenzyme M reductase subunit D
MDIEIFPHRLLSADTTEKLLNKLSDVQGVKTMVVQGPKLPPKEDKHPDRRTIKVKDEELDLQVKTGRIFLEIEDENTIDGVKKVCRDILPFGFNIHVGTFIRKEKTVTDKLKYGEDLDKIPSELVGLTDPNARLTERATIVHRYRKKEL